MSQENQEIFEELMGAVMQGMALHLLEIGTDDVGPKGLETCRSGEVIHLRVRNSKGDVCLQVSGEDTGELANQLVLACLRNISIDHLGILHKRPLKRVLQLQNGKG